MDLCNEAEFFVHQISLDPIPGEAVLVIDHPLSEEPFLNVPPERSLVQIRAIPSCPITRQQKEERGVQHLSLHCLEEGVDFVEVTPQPSLLPAEQTK